jgi:glycosyltransferase involved in cell wall biosynthesis
MTATLNSVRKTAQSTPAQLMVRRVLFVITDLDYGGAETQLRDLVLVFARRGIVVGVVSMLPPVAYRDELTNAGVQVWSLDMKRKRADARMIRSLAHRVHAFEPDIVHSFMIHANILARVSRACAWRQVPLISSARSTNEGGKMPMLAYRITDRWASMTTSVCQAGVDRYVAIGAAPAGRIVYMPNGVDTSCFYPDEERRDTMRNALGIVSDQPAILAVGRFVEAKNHAGMLRAFARVIEAHPNALLFLAGQGPLLSPTRALAQALHLEDSVRFLGVRDDVPDLMRASDLYLMSSLCEGLPNVLIQAAASGLLAVVTDVGGNASVVRDGVTGRVVPPEDDAKLASAVIDMLRGLPTIQSSWGEAARAVALSDFSLESVADRWLNLYMDQMGPAHGHEEWRARGHAIG